MSNSYFPNFLTNWNLADTITRSEFIGSSYAQSHIGCLRSVADIICAEFCSGKFIFFGVFTADGVEPLIGISSVRNEASDCTRFYSAVKLGVYILRNGFIGERIEINNDFGVIFVACVVFIIWWIPKKNEGKEKKAAKVSLL